MRRFVPTEVKEFNKREWFVLKHLPKCYTVEEVHRFYEVCKNKPDFKKKTKRWIPEPMLHKLEHYFNDRIIYILKNKPQRIPEDKVKFIKKRNKLIETKTTLIEGKNVEVKVYS